MHGTLPAGDYRIACKTSGFYDSGQASFDLQLTATPDQPSGFSESASLPPTETISNPTPLYRFKGVASPVWVSVPTSNGLEFTMKDGGLFTDILAFPSGASGTYSITDGDRVLGNAGPGGSFRFGTPGIAGVSRFQIRGIKPSDGARFALQLALNNPSGDFEVTPIRTAPLKVVLATDPSNSQVIRLNLATGAKEGPFTSGVAINFPADLVEGPDHDIYVLDSNFSGAPNRVLRFDGATGQYKKTVATTPGDAGYNRSLAFGPDGALYVLTSGQNIYKYDPQTGAELQHTVATTKPPNDFATITFGPDGLLYVSNISPEGGAILKYSSAGSPLGLFALAGDGNGPRKPLWRDGKVFVANLNDGKILSFDAATGQDLGVFSDPPSNGLEALAVTPEGNFLVSNVWLENVTEISGVDGSVLRVFADHLITEAILIHELAGLPEITAQPQGGAFPPNTPVTLSVTATGGPLTYQWKKDDAALPGETAATLSIASLQTGGAGSYRVVVSNSTGSVTSEPAVVTVKEPACVPVPSGLVAWWPGEGLADFVAGDNLVTQGAVTFAPGKVGQALAFDGSGGYAFDELKEPVRFGGFTLSTWVKHSRLAQTQRYITFWPDDTAIVRFLDGGWVQAYVRTEAGNIFAQSNQARLNTEVYYLVTATYDGASLNLYLNGELLASSPASGRLLTATTAIILSTSFEPMDGELDEPMALSRALSASEIRAIYTAGSAGMCLVAPKITRQPVGGAFTSGTALPLSVGVEGLGLSYQWQKDGKNLPGQTDATLAISNLKPADGGRYRVLVSNATGSVASDEAVVRVQPATWNAQSDFSSQLNPSGQWSYGYKTDVRSPEFHLYTAKGLFDDLDFWYLEQPTGLPNLGRARSDGPFWSSNDLLLHPGDTVALFNYSTVLRWTAPRSDSYTVNVGFTGADSREPTVDVQVFVIRNTLIEYQANLRGMGTLRSFAKSYFLSAGDVLEFIVGNNDTPSDSDYVRISANVTEGAVLPVITSQPVQQTVSPGGPVTLSIGATGEALAYQWRRNGKPIPGATAASYTVAKAGGENAGSYDVVVTGRDGSVTSAAASVFVLDLQMFAGLVIAGPVGGQVRVEYTNDIQQQTGWTALNTLSLPRSPYVFIDESSPGQPKRFYRAVPVQ